MADNKPDIANMEPIQYVEARMAQLSEEAQKILGLGDPANRAQVSHMFSVEYIRLRHAMLEQNCLQFMRRYMAAMNALEKAVGSVRASQLFQESLKKVPESMQEVPQL